MRPHAATHVPLALCRLRNDVKRSGNRADPVRLSRTFSLVLIAGPFDRFATVPPVPTGGFREE